MCACIGCAVYGPVDLRSFKTTIRLTDYCVSPTPSSSGYVPIRPADWLVREPRAHAVPASLKTACWWSLSLVVSGRTLLRAVILLDGRVVPCVACRSICRQRSSKLAASIEGFMHCSRSRSIWFCSTIRWRSSLCSCSCRSGSSSEYTSRDETRVGEDAGDAESAPGEPASRAKILLSLPAIRTRSVRLNESSTVHASDQRALALPLTNLSPIGPLLTE